MNKKIKNKESLVQEIGMKYDEAVELFSDETLESMVMNNIFGGTNMNGCTKGSDTNGKHCAQDVCNGSSSSNSSNSNGSNSNS